MPPPFTYTVANLVDQGVYASGAIQQAEGITWDGQQLVIADANGSEIWTLPRNADGSYTTSNITDQGTFPTSLGVPQGITWDGQQLVILGGNKISTLPRNADGSYTPANAVGQGNLVTTGAASITWDGQQIIVGENSGDEIWTLPRNADGSYTTFNAVNQGEFEAGLASPLGLTWDTEQLVISASDRIWTLSRNADGSYTPANAAQIEGSVGFSASGITWDGLQLAITDDTAIGGLHTLLPNNRAPDADAGPAQTVDPFAAVDLDGTGSDDPDGDTITYAWIQASGPTVTLRNPTTSQPSFDAPASASAITLIFQVTVTDPSNFTGSDTVTITVRAFVITLSATPTIIDHAGTTALLAAVSHTPSGLAYRWTASAGGTFSAQTTLSTNWTSPTSVVLATVVDITFTATLSGISLAKTIQVTVRAQGTPPLDLPTYADQTGVTGATVDLTIATATGGRAPYSYAYADLPEELGAIDRRIRGRLITPGVKTVTVTVTDANGDTATATFDWTVTGAAILPPAGVNVRIDWGRSFFARDEANVTGKIRSGISAGRGRTINSAILGRTAAGSMTFQLDNSDGLYDLENTSSPLHGLIEPGVLVQLRDGGEPMWTGVLDSIPTEYDDDAGQHRAHVTALGIYSTLRDATVHEGSLEPASTIQAFCDLLAVNDACGVPDPAASYFQMQQWWETGKLRDALHHIEDTEGGFAFEDPIGNIGLQAAGHRGTTLAATFTGLSAPLAGEFKIAGRPQREIAVKDVHNEVLGFVRQFERRTSQDVFQRVDAIPIDRGGSVTLYADFDDETGGNFGGAVESLITPVSGTHYTANDEMDGSGTDRSSLLDVVPTISQFNEIEVIVNYPVTPGAPAEIFITSITIRGAILRPIVPSKIARRNQSSIEKYKLKTLPLRDTWIQSQANMEARADAILALLDTPETRLRFSWYISDYADFRALELSDRIRLKLPAYTDDAYIEHLTLYIPISGILPRCTIQATVTSVVVTPPPPPPPPPAGDSVTANLTGLQEFTNYIRWPDNVSLGSTFAADGAEQTLNFVDLNNNSPAGRVSLAIVGFNRRFTTEFEATGLITFEASDGEMLEVQIADADMTETYAWTPTNSAEVVAFVAHVRGLTDQDVTLTLSD